MKIKIKKLHKDAIIPKYAHEGDSGFDLFALEEIVIPAGETKLIGTGLSFEIPLGWELQVRPRSGLSLKTPLRISNSPGTVDASFRGEVCIILTNIADNHYKSEFGNLIYGCGDQHIKKGDRIAQGVICPIIQAEFELADDLENTERGSNGFGSTGQ